jgi:hypothetical protein
MSRIDEQGLRREGFREGVPIALADGQAWHFPRPVLTFYPTFEGGGKPTFSDSRHTFGPKYDDLVEGFLASEDGYEEANGLLALAVDLLARNYDLRPEDFRALLPRMVGDLDNDVMWGAIADVALGRAPKPTAGGSAPSS